MKKNNVTIEEGNTLQQLLKSISGEELLKMLLSNSNGIQMNNRDATLGQGMKEYEKLVEFNLSPNSLRSVKILNRQVLKFIPENRLINSIDRKAADNLVMKLAETAPKGIETYHGTLCAEFNTFVSWGYTSNNPFEKIRLPKKQKEDFAVFSDQEILLVRNRLNEKGTPVIADMVFFSLNTGVRGGELVNLRWTDIDFKGKKLNVGSKHYKTKSRKIREIPFNKTVEEILIQNSQRQMRNGKIIREFVFTQSNGRPYMLDTISKHLKKVIRELKLDEGLHWHSLRHTAATNLVNKGTPLPVVQKILGHAQISTSMIYIKNNLDDLRDAINRL